MQSWPLGKPAVGWHFHVVAPTCAHSLLAHESSALRPHEPRSAILALQVPLVTPSVPVHQPDAHDESYRHPLPLRTEGGKRTEEGKANKKTRSSDGAVRGTGWQE